MSRSPSPGDLFSPAVLELLTNGVTVTQLAGALYTTPTTVSRWLRGRHSAPQDLFGAIAALGSHDLAAAVRSAIPTRKAAA